MKTKQTSTIFTDLRMVPLALVSWSLMWLVTGNLLSPIAVLLVGVSLAALILRFRISPKLVAVALLAIAMAIIGLVRVDRMSVIGELLATDKTVVAVQVKLPSEPRLFTKGTRPAFALAKCELLQITIRGNRYQTDLPVTVVATNSTAKTFAELKVGSVIEFFAIATSPEEGEPVAAVLKITKDLKISSGPGIVDNTINRIRSALVAAMANSPPRQAALIPSLVVGDTSAIDETMAEQFKATALTHLLAVSGANLTLLLAFLLTVVKWLGIRGWAIRAIALTGVVAFIAICRGEPSVLRAAAMGIVSLAALGSGRGGHAGLRNLSVAIIALLILDPWLARSWGFALSVSASAGILIWGKAWKEAMQTWAPEWFSEALVIPLAAQLATQPLITALSGQISIIGLVANLLVGVFVGPATVLGLAAALLGAIVMPLGVILGWLAGLVVQPIIWAAEFGSALPNAVWQVSSSTTITVLVLIGSLLAAFAIGMWIHKPITIIGLITAMVLISAIQLPVPGWPGDWQVVFCDVGQGDSTVIRVGDNNAVVIDVGPDNNLAVKCLNSLGITHIPLLVLTHYHSDHIGGLSAVLDSFSVQRVLLSRTASPKDAAYRVRKSLDSLAAEMQIASPGEKIIVGDVIWTTISDGEVTKRPLDSAAENDASIIGIAEIDGLSVLLPGDAEPDGQRKAVRIAENIGISLAVEIFKLPHHGSARQYKEFFRRSHAKLAIASAGKDNEYGHPAKKTLRLASSMGMINRRTDTEGSIAVQLAADSLIITTTN